MSHTNYNVTLLLIAGTLIGLAGYWQASLGALFSSGTVC
jgi:hypothetical protein